MEFLQELNEAMRTDAPFEKKEELINSAFSEGMELKEIAKAVEASAVCCEDEKQRIYSHLISLWMDRYESHYLETLSRKHIKEYIHLAVLLDEPGEHLIRAAEFTRTSGKASKEEYCGKWRKMFSRIHDYNRMVRLFCIVDERAFLDDKIMKELFTAYNYTAGEKEWAQLIATEFKLKHVALLERLYKVAGSAEHFVELSGQPWEQIVEQLEAMDMRSRRYVVTARLIAEDIRIAFQKDTYSYEQRIEYYLTQSSLLTANLASYLAHRYFLEHGTLNEEIKGLIDISDGFYEKKLHSSVIRLHISCVDKCLREGIDIVGFINDTKSVNMFAKDSRLKALKWQEKLDSGDDGFAAEKAHAEERLAELLDTMTDSRLLTCIYFNTYFGAFCDLKDFISALNDRGEDIRELFSEYPLFCRVYNLDPKFRKVVAKILRYNCNNISMVSVRFRGVISRHNIISVRITGITSRCGGELSIQAELVSPEFEYDEEKLIACLEGISADCPDEPFDVKGRLIYVPWGWSYRYNSIDSCLFGFVKTFRLITACKEFVSLMAERFGAEAALDIFMESFLRVSMPIEVLCTLLTEKHGASAEELDTWLSEYQFDGSVREDQNTSQFFFMPASVLMSGTGFPYSGSERGFGRARLGVIASDAGVTVVAHPISDTEKSYNPRFVHKNAEVKIMDCSEKIDTSLGRKEIIDQAAGQWFYDEVYVAFIRGLFLRIMKCGFKRRRAVVQFLNYFEAVNEFAYRSSIYSSENADRIYARWQRVKVFVEEDYDITSVISAFFSLGLTYGEMCFVYLNSPLRYEISLSDFLRECIEDFVTENTAVPQMRLLGRRVDEHTFMVADIRDETGEQPVISVRDDILEFEWFTFLPEFDLSGALRPVDITKCVLDVPLFIKPSNSVFTDLLKKEITQAIERYFTNEELRNSSDLYTEIAEQRAAAHTYIGDMVGEYRIFVRLIKEMNEVSVVPLNVSFPQDKTLTTTGGFIVEPKSVYSMVPVFWNADGELMLMPVARYKDRSDIAWEGCFKESDIPYAPKGVCIGRHPYSIKKLDYIEQIIAMYKEKELAEIIDIIKRSKFRCTVHMNKLLKYWREDEINECLKDITVLFFNKNKATANYRFDITSVRLLLPCDEGSKAVSISPKTKINAVLLMRFAGCDQGTFSFSLEKAYRYDGDISWNLFTEISEIPPEAEELADVLSMDSGLFEDVVEENTEEG